MHRPRLSANTRKRLAALVTSECRESTQAEEEGTSESCPVCLDELVKDHEERSEADEKEADLESAEEPSFVSRLPCGHRFHESCIVDGWIRTGRGTTCPMCNCELEQLFGDERKQEIDSGDAADQESACPANQNAPPTTQTVAHEETGATP
eukprot:Plantae.Rhodophyta-Rhodochaete_pulchella.ctg21670.p1 GENE.Plantae.Rhodophyta-Rhodochaete_pulchella.ctg21670~~Plantae.Rhodophyta-Rhodochaete_pulchella.ctg21670.p1  ORF type:complete len:171 (-),score=9.48 Plantae.Rhodophyta-Rhodochaete_pulchella.ctg21670:52-504(-)